jgi:N-acetyl-anhydromuramyl-L-alanine amidase AmpD
METSGMSVLDLTSKANTEWRKKTRPWGTITQIVLHQTACHFGEKPERWLTLKAHIGVTRGGQILLIHPLDSFGWHAQGLSHFGVGVEIEGRLAGVEGNLKTFWRPKGETYPPDEPGPNQINAARETVQWICAQVAAHGGKVKEVCAHRQSSKDRQGDPGSAIWQEVGVWARKSLGLETPLKRVWGTGAPIPRVWDAEGGADAAY